MEDHKRSPSSSLPKFPMKLLFLLPLVGLLCYSSGLFLPSWLGDLTIDLSSAPKVRDEIPGGTPIETCETDTPQLIEIERVELEPYPPVPGENLTITASGVLLAPIEEGAYVDVLVRYGFIQLVNQRYDLCELLPEVELECPLQKGYLSLTRDVELPANVPPGEYYVEAHAYTNEDELLTCLTATVEF